MAAVKYWLLFSRLFFKPFPYKISDVSFHNKSVTLDLLEEVALRSELHLELMLWLFFLRIWEVTYITFHYGLFQLL